MQETTNEQAGHMIDIARRVTETVRSEAAAIGLGDENVVPTLVQALARALAKDIGAGASGVRVAQGIMMVGEFLTEAVYAYLDKLDAEEGAR